MIKQTTCRQCRKELSGYIQRVLSPSARRRVSAHLDTCPACYTVYVNERDVVRTLTQQVPMIGRADAPRLGKIWSAVQGEMARPRRSPLPPILKRYSPIMVIVLVFALLPGFQAFQQHQAVMALPVPPTPTETIERTVQAVAMATAECLCASDGTSDGASEAIATSAPAWIFTVPAQPNYAPNVKKTAVP